MPTTATITSTALTDFVPGTLIKSSEVDANFAVWRGHIIPVSPSASAAVDATYDLGAVDRRWQNGIFSAQVTCATVSSNHISSQAFSAAYTTVSATYSTTSNDYAIYCNAGSAFSVSLTSAATVGKGRMFFIKKTDTSFNAVTIDPTGAETIVTHAGATITTTLNTIGESVRLISDGTNWQILERIIPSFNTAFTMSIGATTTQPTKATTRLNDEAFWMRQGDSCKVTYTYAHNSNVGAATGSGDYAFHLPTGLAINRDKLQFAASFSANRTVVGTGFATGGTHTGVGICLARADFDAVSLYFEGDVAAQVAEIIVSGTDDALTNSTARYCMIFTLPITGWNA